MYLPHLVKELIVKNFTHVNCILFLFVSQNLNKCFLLNGPLNEVPWAEHMVTM